MRSNDEVVYVGIDVSKAWLDIARGGEEKVERVGNDAAGIAQLVEELSQMEKSLIVVEATGGLEMSVFDNIKSRHMTVK